MTRPTLAALLLLSLVCASPVAAQHAEFVLLGGPSPEAANAKPEHAFVHPVTSPYYHEDSFVTTDVRAWYAYHRFPGDIALDGGHAQVAAVQLRLAITNQIQFVAYKDGYMDLDTGLIDESGFNDLGAGVKWNFWQDWKNQFHAAVGAGYEFATGEEDVLQQDAEGRFWISLNKGFGALHLGVTTNFLISEGEKDTLGNSDRFFWHAHADYYVCKFFSPVLEFNGYHLIDDGKEFVPFSGADVLNLGGGEDAVTLGAGLEIRPIKRVAARVAYETSLLDRDDLYGDRWTFSLILSF